MLNVARLRLAEEVICDAMSQHTRELLLWDARLFSELLEGGSRLEGDKVLYVVFEDGLQAHGCGKLFRSTHCLGTRRQWHS